MNDLTPKAQKVLEFITQYQARNGYSPSLEEIKVSLNTRSTRGVVLQLEKLQKLGFIQRDPKIRRAIRILNPNSKDKMAEEEIKIPIIGEIKAGYNALAEQNIEGYKKIPISLARGRRDSFLLRVRGESMLKAGFKPGDLVVVMPQSTATNGDIVVAFDPGEETATLKRFKKMQNFVVLLPESDDPQYKPIIERYVLIQGKVIDKLPHELI